MFKIVLDAGHVLGYNKYPPNTNFNEGERMFKLSLYLKEELEKYGFEVLLTRTKVTDDPALDVRGAMAGKNKADLFLSLHSNALSNAVSSVTGTEIFYSVTDSNNKKLSDQLGKMIAEVMGHGYRGSKTKVQSNGTDWFGVIRSSAKSGCKAAFLVEHGFHSSVKDCAFLIIDANLQKLAKAEAGLLAEFYGQSLVGTNLTKIMDSPVATAYQMSYYLKSINKDTKAIEYAELYISEGRLEGVRGDIAFAQSLLETGNFTFKGSAVKFEQNNFCGMGVTSNGMTGNSFATPQLGIRAQIQHLKAYADTSPLVSECIDPRFKYVTRGIAPYIEWLGAKENPKGTGWASGEKYGEKILGILNSILKMPLEKPQEPKPTEPTINWEERAWIAESRVLELESKLEQIRNIMGD